MAKHEDLISAIGNTPLIRLNRVSTLTGCEIWGKAEFLNPGQSVKDRAALFIIHDAVKSGRLKPGGTIVEGTAGNTGIGLTLVANSLGFKSVIVIPETQSQEKKDALRLYGAELIEVPAKPYRNPNNYIKISGRLADKLNAELPNGAVWANQFDNVSNRRAHVETTGPEIWQQTNGRIDGFICAVGSGGTLAGVAEALRARNPDVKIGLADPEGAALYEYYKHGELKSSGDSITEGIGQGRITANLEGLKVDMPYRIPDSEALPYIFDLLEHEGLCLGGSSAINIAGAVRMARDLGPGHTIVTVLCDYGNRYASKIFNPAFLRGKNLPVPPWMEGRTPIDISSVIEPEA
ncbi:cysteine synthase A [Devosia salina]|uniref:Cysteine synthase A n=1 Tax=Devosia salina TaxID=2860336 RepID=A0ABX8WJS5_9HYPH|nr:cysteine synthase A [Devosia salina]QYO78259.1 cysteine synthase A [Devosia salina]